MTAAPSQDHTANRTISDIIRQVTSLIESGVEQSARLLQLLETERSTLICRDSDSLAATLAAKNNALQNIDDTQQQLLILLQSSGYAESLDAEEKLSLKRLLQIFLKAVARAEADPRFHQDNSLPTLERCSSQYRKLQEILNKCRNNNNINGIIISNSQARTRQSLHILSGQSQQQSASELGLLYTADGIKAGSNRNQGLSSA